MPQPDQTAKIWNTPTDNLTGGIKTDNDQLSSIPEQYLSLFSNGFYVGDSKEFIESESDYNNVLSRVEELCNEKEKYFHYRHHLQYYPDHAHLPHAVPIEEIEERKNFVKSNNLSLIQQWYEVKIEDEKVYEIKNYFRNRLQKILFELYPELNRNNISYLDTITLYENEDFIIFHEDGKVLGRLCAILVYLSDVESYNDGGGKLLLSDKDTQIEVLPLRGNYVILDFTKHNIAHAVEAVKNNFRRFCYLSFIFNNDKVIN